MKKILLVDGARYILEREKSLLDREALHVFTAGTAAEAIEIHKREKVDIIVMDLNMADIPGDEVCKMIRENPLMKKVSIILTSLIDSPEEWERCKVAGANACLRKPIRKSELDEKISTLLGISARREIRILVKIKLDAKAGSDFFIANTVDVSQTGLLFECDRALDIGNILESSFFLPVSSGFKRVVSNAEIVRAVPVEGKMNRYGIKFTIFTEGGPHDIGEFIARKNAANAVIDRA